MRLPRRVWSPGVLEYCPAPLAGVAVRRGSGLAIKVVGGSDGGGGRMAVMSGGRKSPEYEKQTRTQNTPTEHKTKTLTFRTPQITAAVYRVGPVCGKK